MKAHIYSIRDPEFLRETLEKSCNISKRKEKDKAIIYNIKFGQHEITVCSLPNKAVIASESEYSLVKFEQFLNISNFGRKALFPGKDWEQYI